MTRTEKLRNKMANIAFGNEELRYAMANAMLKACKEAGLMFVAYDVEGFPELEEEIEIG